MLAAVLHHEELLCADDKMFCFLIHLLLFKNIFVMKLQRLKKVLLHCNKSQRKKKVFVMQSDSFLPFLYFGN